MVDEARRGEWCPDALAAVVPELRGVPPGHGDGRRCCAGAEGSRCSCSRERKAKGHDCREGQQEAESQHPQRRPAGTHDGLASRVRGGSLAGGPAPLKRALAALQSDTVDTSVLLDVSLALQRVHDQAAVGNLQHLLVANSLKWESEQVLKVEVRSFSQFTVVEMKISKFWCLGLVGTRSY